MSRSKGSRRKERETYLRRRNLGRGAAAAPESTDAVAQANRLMDRGQWNEARKVLEDRLIAHPQHKATLRLLLDVYNELRDYGPYLRTCRALIELEPNDRFLHVMLAGGYVNAARPILALRAFREFLRRWPDDPLAEGLQQSVAELEPLVKELLQAAPFAEHERLELAALHEEVLVCLAAGDHARVIERGEELLARSPDFLPAMNNLSEAYWVSGRSDRAIEMSRRVLQSQPDNFHAAANLARYLLLNGQRDEAEQMRERLQSIRADNTDAWCKKAETFSYFGDDRAVIDVFEQAQRAGAMRGPTRDALLLYHLAGVAFARQGDYHQARRYWQRALKIRPGFDLAQGNLDDADLPAGERNGAWPYTLNYWISKELFTALSRAIDLGADRSNDDAVAEAARRFADEHPEFAGVLPLLLDRGDESSCEFALRFAKLLATPEMHEALKSFALSQRGPDSMRMEAANYLNRQGVLPEGPVSLCLGGLWRDIELIGFEISDEPVGPGHSDQVAEWLHEALELLRCGDGRRAEELLQRCLEVESDKPDLLNNLALAYAIQGRTDEAHQLLRQVHERWPDYFFGRIGMARLAIEEGEYDRAQEYLAPLSRRKRLHSTEFAVMCDVNIHLWLARKDMSGVQKWFDMWRQVDPDHPRVRELEPLITLSSAISNLADRRRRRRT